MTLIPFAGAERLRKAPKPREARPKPVSRPALIGCIKGQWTVKAIGKMQNRNQYYICVCECGTERPVLALSLRNGESTGCGCKRRTKQAATMRERDNGIR